MSCVGGNLLIHRPGGPERYTGVRGRPAPFALMFVAALCAGAAGCDSPEPARRPDAGGVQFVAVRAEWEKFALAHYRDAVRQQIPAGDRLRFIGTPILIATTAPDRPGVVRLRISGEIECLDSQAQLARRHFTILWLPDGPAWRLRSCVVVDSAAG